MSNLETIRRAVIDNATLCEFSYRGKSCHIDPWYEAGQDHFLLWMEHKEKIVHSFEDAVHDSFWDGLSLQEIEGEIINIDW